MRTILGVTSVALGLLVGPASAIAQCHHHVAAIADGRVQGPYTSGPGSVVVPYFYARAGHSYSIEVVSQNTAIASATSPASSCPPDNGPGVIQNPGLDPVVDSRVDRVTYTASAASTVFTRVPLGMFTYSVSDTTLYNPSWSTAGSFGTQWGLQNTTSGTVTGTLRVTESFGGTAIYTRAVTIPPNSGVFVTTSDSFTGGPIPAGRGGTARFTHTGPPGAVLGDGYLVNATQTIPILFRAVRDGGR